LRTCSRLLARRVGTALLLTPWPLACSSPPTELQADFRPAEARRATAASSEEALQLFTGATADDAYRIGPGDVLGIAVWGHDDLSGPQTVGPDGRISLPVVGSFRCAGLTRDEAGTAIAETLTPYYPDLAVTVRVEQYLSNQLAVLGDVNAPGAYVFPSPPTLLSAISRAGGVTPRETALDAPTRCSVLRGRDALIRIELGELLERGNLSLNIPLRADDVLYVKHADDEIVYVLGEVANPGVYPVNPGMSLLDAIAVAGGLTEDSQPEELLLLRTIDGTQVEIDMEKLLEGDLALNLSLQEGDIVFAPRSGIATFGYVWRQINPFAFVFAASD